MKVIEFLKQLEPALPLSPIRAKDGSFRRMSNSDIRRACEQHIVLFNGAPVDFDEEIDFPVFSLVFYPKNPKRRTTLL